MIIFEDVSKIYGEDEAKVVALKSVSVKISKGEFVCVWGASGSGKSTFLNLAGLIDTPSSGIIQINGKSIKNLTNDEMADYRNQNIGYVFQNFNLVPVLNALENVMIPLQIRGVSAKEAKASAAQLLADVGLENELYRRPDKMSGGQRQRVAIARALVGQPKIVLADEPTANLDSSTADATVKLMKELNVKKGVTFILSTHDKDLIAHASRNMYLRDGQFSEKTQPNSLTLDEALEDNLISA